MLYTLVENPFQCARRIAHHCLLKAEFKQLAFRRGSFETCLKPNYLVRFGYNPHFTLFNVRKCAPVRKEIKPDENEKRLNPKSRAPIQQAFVRKVRRKTRKGSERIEIASRKRGLELPESRAETLPKESRN